MTDPPQNEPKEDVDATDSSGTGREHKRRANGACDVDLEGQRHQLCRGFEKSFVPFLDPFVPLLHLFVPFFFISV